MKYFLKLFLFVCTISLVVIACTKDDDEPSISTFSAMVDASNFVSTNVSATLDSNATTSTKKQLTIVANNGTQQLTISLPDYNEALPLGTYTISNGRAIAIYNGTGTEDLAISGQVVVTSASRSFVNGTVTFTTTSGVQITDGRFSVEVEL